MADDLLKQVLQEADATAGEGPAIGGDLAQRVRILAARRRRLNWSLSAAAAIVLATGTTLLLPETGSSTRSPAFVAREQLSPAVTRAEVDRLRREADTRLAIVLRTQELIEQHQRLLALEEQCATLKKRAEAFPDVVAEMQKDRDQAARAVVAMADRMCREMDQCDAALAEYQRVVDYFADSRWADVARQRIDELKNKGEMS